jgi:hypothetical protein
MSRPGARWGLAAVLIWAVAASCSSAAPRSREELDGDLATGQIGVRVTLDAAPDGSCCLVSTVNPGDALSVVCFVDVFDPEDDYVTTVLLPPKPAGHRRSSGFVAPERTSSQGVFEIPLVLGAGSYRSTCRPAAWHGGAPI